MNKIHYFRQRVMRQYETDNLADAAEAGEALLREHWHNHVRFGVPYANDVFNLALVYDQMGLWDRALDMYAESARLVHEEEGDTAEFAERVGNIAALLSRLGRAEQAYQLYTHMAAVLRVTLDAKAPALADGLYNLANAAADVGRKEEALRLHIEALLIREKIGANADAVHSLHSLAFLHEGEKTAARSLGYAKAAMLCAQEALEGPDIPPDEVAEREHKYYSATFYLAELHENMGEYEQAEALYAPVMRWTMAQEGDDHSAYLNVASRLANTLACRGKYPEALAMYREMSERFRHAAGASHLFYANNLRSMALLHAKLDEWDEAERLMLESIKIRRSGLDDIDADALFLIDRYLRADEPGKALDMLVYVLMDADESQPRYQTLLTRLAETFARAGQADLDNLSAAMAALCRRDTVKSVIQKWRRWEKALE